jgi:hypothetical protein
MGNREPIYEDNDKVSTCGICDIHGVVNKYLVPIKFMDAPNGEIRQIFACANCLDSLKGEGYVELGS